MNEKQSGDMRELNMSMTRPSCGCGNAKMRRVGGLCALKKERAGARAQIKGDPARCEKSKLMCECLNRTIARLECQQVSASDNIMITQAQESERSRQDVGAIITSQGYNGRL